LDVFAVSIFGSPISPKSEALRQKRLALMNSPDFQVILLNTCQESSSSVDLTNLCLDLLWTITSGSGQLKHLTKFLNVPNFLKHNFINASSYTSNLAFKILNGIIQQSDASFKVKKNGGMKGYLYFFKRHKCCKIVFLHCQWLLTDVCHQEEWKISLVYFQLFGQMVEFSANFLNVIESLDAYNYCLDMARQLGNKLYDRRSPFYNILRTYYSLYGYPLELDVFSPRGNTDAEKRNQVQRKHGRKILIFF
jgi:hypothetical protein